MEKNVLRDNTVSKEALQGGAERSEDRTTKVIMMKECPSRAGHTMQDLATDGQLQQGTH